MNTIFNRVQLFLEFRNRIDQYLADFDNNQAIASREVFRAQGWDIHVDAIASAGACNIVYGAHDKFVDSCAFNLILPDQSPCKSIVNRFIARQIGERYLAENFDFSPSFQTQRFWDECHDWYTRFYYATSSSWSRTFPIALPLILSWLRGGNNLILFPAGVFGRAKWQIGIGVMVRDYLRNREQYARPLNLIAAKNEFDFSRKKLRVRQIEAIDSEQLPKICNWDPARTKCEAEITEILFRRYTARSKFEV